MRSFDRDDRRDGGRSGGRFGDRKPRSRGFDDGGQGRPTMHKATCSDCGSACEVPFRPTGNKPVLCSNCFKGGASQGFGRNAGGRSFSKPRFDDKRMFEAICDKCNKSCEVPFRPTGDKPIYCSECFTKGDSAGSKSNEQLNKQIDAINSKLDRILKALARTAPDAMVETQEEVKPVSKSKKGGVIIVASKKKIIEDEPIVEKKVKKVKAEKKVAKKTKKEKK